MISGEWLLSATEAVGCSIHRPVTNDQLTIILSCDSIWLLFLTASDILSEFVHVMLHGILFTREIYPQGAFERRKMYDVPVQVYMLQLFKSNRFFVLHYLNCLLRLSMISLSN